MVSCPTKSSTDNGVHSAMETSIDFRDTTRHTPIIVPQKPTRPITSAKNVEGDFGQFTNFMKRLLAVPHSEIKAKLDAEKRAKARKSKRTSASRASRARTSASRASRAKD
jgi:hypothetical protein